jgi:hypothetical protein
MDKRRKSLVWLDWILQTFQECRIMNANILCHKRKQPQKAVLKAKRMKRATDFSKIDLNIILEILSKLPPIKFFLA